MSSRTLPLALAALLGVAAPLAAPATAQAFCGFYVSGADQKLYNNATLVVMMREGTRTVLSMQNNYQGPPEDFAMVVPVPIVLQEENVKTLAKELFTHVDQLAAPRLVEYWEQDPCYVEPPWEEEAKSVRFSAQPAPMPEADEADDLGVKIEAQFTVGEYQIVILSAKDASGLDTWLRREKYAIPPGAEPLLRPYVEEGMKFFVAKVDIKKVQFDAQGQVMLSPLRFHYDSPEFRLPVRLGLINSQGTQDLLIHILSRGKRYEVANYPNATIPTNIDVDDSVRERFGEFYAALFDATIAQTRGAVITEYSWDSGTCDPCPTPPLDGNEIATLGGDVSGAPQEPWGYGSMVLTRLHARYGKESLGEDLIFREAPAIVGGREWMMDGGKVEKGARQDGTNNFQARYVIRHKWTGPIHCQNPIRGRWGGPWPGETQSGPKAATDLAFAKRGDIALPRMVEEDIPEIGVMMVAEGPPERVAKVHDTAPPAETPPATTPAAEEASKHGSASAITRSACSCRSDGGDPTGLLAGLGVVIFAARRRRR
ncbi:MAG: DUF2330 domain-containing protein [Nannocystaceae bacterium]